MSRWQEAAACRNAPPELFFPEDHIAGAGTKEWRAESEAVARAWCLRCPVRLECFAFAVEDPHMGAASRGVFGGVNFLDRRPWNEGDRPVRCACGTIIDPLPALRLGEDTTACWECCT